MEFTTDSFTPQAQANFGRQLEHIRAEILEVKRPPLNGFAMLTQANDVPEWANEYTHEMWEPLGIAQLLADDATDVPMADVSFREETFNVRDFGIGYKYTVKELLQSQHTGKQINIKRALACRLGVEQKMNRIMTYGDPVAKLFGMFNFLNTPRLIAASGINGGTPATVLALLNEWANSIFDLTETAASPTRVMMAPSDYTYISTTPLNLAGGAETTILTHFLANNPFITEVVPMIECKGAGPTGGNIVVIDHPDVFEHKLVQAFTQYPPEARGYGFVTYTMGRSGGVVTDFPLEGLIVELPN